MALRVIWHEKKNTVLLKHVFYFKSLQSKKLKMISWNSFKCLKGASLVNVKIVLFLIVIIYVASIQNKCQLKALYNSVLGMKVYCQPNLVRQTGKNFVYLIPIWQHSHKTMQSSLVNRQKVFFLRNPSQLHELLL